MTDKGKPGTSAAAGPKKVLLRTPCASLPEFVKRYGKTLGAQIFMVPKPDLYAPGTLVDLEVRLKDGQVAFRADGRVEAGQAGAAETPVRLLSMDQESLDRFRQMAKGRPAKKQAAPSEARRADTLLDSLKKIKLVSETTSESINKDPDNTASVKGVVLGIDLGTTNSCCSLVKNGKPFIVPSRKGHNTIPSIVALDPMGELLVGDAARAQMEINPSRTVYGSKRLVGRPFESPIVNQVRDRFHYEIVAGKGGQAAVKIDEKVISLEQVSSYILTEIRDVAQDYLGKVIMRAVITVPAFYNENQRSAVRRAGQLAGLRVERILNEPTAAALSYGYRKEKKRLVLVYDLGGGTFDASLMRLEGNSFQVLATGGDTFLGGVDFDTQLTDHVLIEFQLQLGKMPKMERVALLRTLQGAENAKRQLSARQETEIRLPFIGFVDDKPVDLQVKVTRDTLDKLGIPMIERTLNVCDEVLAQAGKRPADIDDILLVGGQTRMPLIWMMLEDHFGKTPLKGVHPDESVAVGAALLAASLDSDEDLVLSDVLPMSIGLGVPGSDFIPLLKAGTAVPISRIFALPTHSEGQTKMLVPVYQGDSAQVDENEYLGTIIIRGIPPGPVGSRSIEIAFSLNSECSLSVSASDSEAGPLSEVIMTTQDTPATVRKKLGLGPAPARPVKKPPKPAVPKPAAAKPAEAKPAEAAPSPAADQPPPAAKRGLWGFIKRLFGG